MNGFFSIPTPSCLPVHSSTFLPIHTPPPLPLHSPFTAPPSTAHVPAAGLAARETAGGKLAPAGLAHAFGARCDEVRTVERNVAIGQCETIVCVVATVVGYCVTMLLMRFLARIHISQRLVLNRIWSAPCTMLLAMHWLPILFNWHNGNQRVELFES